MEKARTRYLKDYKRKIATGSEAEAIINKIRRGSKELSNEIRVGLTSKKALKIERYIISAIYVAIFITLGYFFLINTNPDIMPNDFYTYKISASDSFVTNNLRSLYLDDSTVLGGETEVNNQSARLIISEKPFNFIFNPKRKIAENSTAEIRLSMINPGTEIYLNEKLIIPDLDGFEKVADFEDREVWVKNELTKSEYVEGSNSEEFIYSNFPGKNIYAFGEIEGGTPIISDYKKALTQINTRFRDNLKLAVYAEGDLKIEFIKQDLNWYIGKDEYSVEITDLQGNSYFNEVYGDDGDKKDSGVGEFEQKIIVEGKDLPKNIYYVTFTKDENNKAGDSTIKDIKINSNKVLIVGRILPLNEFKFYTEISSPQKIGFKYWWSGKEQKIKISGDISETIDLNEDWKEKRYEQNLTKGEYNFEIETGTIWIYSSVISPSKSNWFYLPSEGDEKLINQDIIVIDKNKLQINENEVIYTGRISIEENSKIKIQALDKLETYFKEIKLVL